jgi:hypothetical protein
MYTVMEGISRERTVCLVFVPECDSDSARSRILGYEGMRVAVSRVQCTAALGSLVQCATGAAGPQRLSASAAKATSLRSRLTPPRQLAGARKDNAHAHKNKSPRL